MWRDGDGSGWDRAGQSEVETGKSPIPTLSKLRKIVAD